MEDKIAQRLIGMVRELAENSKDAKLSLASLALCDITEELSRALDTTSRFIDTLIKK